MSAARAAIGRMATAELATARARSEKPFGALRVGRWRNVSVEGRVVHHPNRNACRAPFRRYAPYFEDSLVHELTLIRKKPL